MAFAVSDDSRLYTAPAHIQRAAHRHAYGLHVLPSILTEGTDAPDILPFCPVCQRDDFVATATPLYPAAVALSDHLVRCGKPAVNSTHDAIVRELATIAGDNLDIPKPRILLEQAGLRPDRTRPSDLTLLDYDGPGQHLFIDVTVRCPFNATGFTHALRPGYQAERGERDKFHADSRSAHPVATHCRLVPFAMETGGRLGAHASALLMEWARRAAGLMPSATARTAASLAQKWSQSVVTTLKLSLVKLATSPRGLPI